MEITLKLKSKTKAVGDIEVPGTGVAFRFLSHRIVFSFIHFQQHYGLLFWKVEPLGRKPLNLNISDVLLLLPAPLGEYIKKIVKEKVNWDLGGEGNAT